jgi:hypothetical protein
VWECLRQLVSKNNKKKKKKKNNMKPELFEQKKDIVVAIICSLPTAFVAALLVPLLYQPPAFFQLIKTLAFISFFGLTLSLFIHPYTKDTPKRIFLQHSTNFDTNISEISVAEWDPIPIPPSFLFGIFSFFLSFFSFLFSSSSSSFFF